MITKLAPSVKWLNLSNVHVSYKKPTKPDISQKTDQNTCVSHKAGPFHWKHSWPGKDSNSESFTGEFKQPFRKEKTPISHKIGVGVLPPQFLESLEPLFWQWKTIKSQPFSIKCWHAESVNKRSSSTWISEIYHEYKLTSHSKIKCNPAHTQNKGEKYNNEGKFNR